LVLSAYCLLLSVESEGGFDMIMEEMTMTEFEGVLT
jgi:hypothetical protein